MMADSKQAVKFQLSGETGCETHTYGDIKDISLGSKQVQTHHCMELVVLVYLQKKQL